MSSNSEIIRSLYKHIHNIHKKKKELFHKDYKFTWDIESSRLFHLIDKLWHALLGMSTTKYSLRTYCENPLEEHINDLSPWKIVVDKYTNTLFLNSANELKDISYKTNILENELSIESLLKTYSKEHAFVFYTYLETTSMWEEYLCKDPRDFSVINKLISDIQGECFNLFIEDNTYTKAYLIHTLYKDFIFWKNYPYQKKDEDALLNWLINNHTSICSELSSLMNIYNEELIKWLLQKHTELKSKDVSILDRVTLIIELCQGFKNSWITKSFKDLLSNHYEFSNELINTIDEIVFR